MISDNLAAGITVILVLVTVVCIGIGYYYDRRNNQG